MSDPRVQAILCAQDMLIHLVFQKVKNNMNYQEEPLGPMETYILFPNEAISRKCKIKIKTNQVWM